MKTDQKWRVNSFLTFAFGDYTHFLSINWSKPLLFTFQYHENSNLFHIHKARNRRSQDPRQLVEHKDLGGIVQVIDLGEIGFSRGTEVTDSSYVHGI